MTLDGDDIMDKAKELNALLEQAIDQDDWTGGFRAALWVARSNHVETMRILDSGLQP